MNLTKEHEAWLRSLSYTKAKQILNDEEWHWYRTKWRNETVRFSTLSQEYEQKKTIKETP